MESLVINSWRISSPNCVSCSRVSFCTCDGLSTISRYRPIVLLVSIRDIRGLERELTCGILLQLLHFDLGLRQLRLAEPGEPRSFLELRHQILQWQLSRFHCIYNSFEFRNRLFERHVRGLFGLGHEAQPSETPPASPRTFRDEPQRSFRTGTRGAEIWKGTADARR